MSKLSRHLDEYLAFDATAQATALRRGEMSAVEATRLQLEAIDRLDPSLNAYVTVTADRAMSDAVAADGRLRSSDADSSPAPFLGVGVSFKDVVDVAGIATTHSCKLLRENIAESDSPVVESILTAGFSVLGKTNVPEFCTSMTDSELNGICRNPWDLDRTPGGSSGGAAAAVSAGLCAVAHGTDGAGSIRVPAAFCGVVGFKGTRGLLTAGPERGTAYYGCSEDGVLTRSVRDAAALLDEMSGGRWGPTRDRSHLAALDDQPRPLRIAVCTEAPVGAVDPECASAATETAEVLESMGHHVVDAAPAWMTMLAVADAPLTVPGMAALVAADQVDALEPRNRPVHQRLASMTVVEHADWVERARGATRDFARFWDDVDILVTPSCGVVAPPIDFAPWDQTPDEHRATFGSFPNFAIAFNLSGQPAVSLPLAQHSSGLPIGVQLAGRHLSEATLLQVAAQLEIALPWHHRRPSVSARPGLL